MTPNTPASHFVDTYVRLFLVHAIFFQTKKHKFRKEGRNPHSRGVVCFMLTFQIFVLGSKHVLCDRSKPSTGVTRIYCALAHPKHDKKARHTNVSCPGSIYFTVHFCVPTIQRYLLFEGSSFSFGKPTEINDS